MMIDKSLVLKVQACDPGPSAENCALMEELFGCRYMFYWFTWNSFYLVRIFSSCLQQ